MTAPIIARQVVLDTTDARALAEFYRQLLDLTYRSGDEPPADGEPDEQGNDWLVLRGGPGIALAFQQIADLPEPTWSEGPRPQTMHLDISVPDAGQLDVQHERATDLGARLLWDDVDNVEEPKRVYADPSGHPFCIFVSPNHGTQRSG